MKDALLTAAVIFGVIWFAARNYDPNAPDAPDPAVTGIFLSDTASLTNRGECPLYETRIWTVPPSGPLQSVAADLFGLNSFSARIGTIERDESLRIPLSRLTNGAGHRLNRETVRIGAFRLHFSHCGTSHTVTWRQ